jgi:hypothetical protein
VRRLALAVAAVCLLAPAVYAPTVHAEERLVEARRVFGFLDVYQALTPAERSQFTLGYALRKDGKPATVDVTLVEANGRRTPLPIDAEGRFLRVPTAAQLAGKPQVAIDVAAGKVAVAMLVESTAKPAAEMSVAPFAPGMAQVNAVVTAKLGMLASLVPKVTRATFVGAPSGKAVMADGREVVLPLSKDGPTFDPVALKGARSLRFPSVPAHIRFEADRK